MTWGCGDICLFVYPYYYLRCSSAIYYKTNVVCKYLFYINSNRYLVDRIIVLLKCRGQIVSFSCKLRLNTFYSTEYFPYIVVKFKDFFIVLYIPRYIVQVLFCLSFIDFLNWYLFNICALFLSLLFLIPSKLYI